MPRPAPCVSPALVLRRQLGGQVSDVVLEGDQVTGIVVDVGGFLGIGEKPVVLAPEMIEVWQDADGSMYEVKVKATREELEALPAHNAG